MQPKWSVKATPETSLAINLNRAQTCCVRLRVKYESEKDWITHTIFMTPGWEPLNIWKQAYLWIHDQNSYYKHITKEDAVVEEARLDEFKLI